MPDLNIEVTEMAQVTIRNMWHKVQELGNNYGIDSQECSKAGISLALGLEFVLTTAIKVTADDPAGENLSLYCMSPHIHFGVNWSRHSQTWSVNS